MRNRQIHLVSRPAKDPEVANFALREAPMPEPTAGEVLLRTLYLSLDPYMRARMYEGENYAGAAVLNEPMTGASIAKVIESRNAEFPVGTIVESNHGWQEYAVSDGTGLRVIDPGLAPVTTALGVLGMPGQTGYTALVRYGQPKPGETLVVSAASGAVGSVVGQVARKLGLRVVGIAGSNTKCRFLTEELGFDAAVNHRGSDFSETLAIDCPSGVDIYYDNVGGRVFRTVMPHLNPLARVLVCGTVSVNRDAPGADESGPLQDLLSTALVKRLTIKGFVYTDDDLMALAAEFRERVGAWIRDGSLRYREDIVEGLDAAPEAFLRLFKGENFGKLLVRVAPE